MHADFLITELTCLSQVYTVISVEYFAAREALLTGTYSHQTTYNQNWYLDQSQNLPPNYLENKLTATIF